MGHFFSFCSPNIKEFEKPLEVIKNDAIQNYDHALVASKMKYADDTCSNYLIGYPHEISISNTNFIKQENGPYLYQTNFRSIDSYFLGRCDEKFDIINDIRMANKNKNVEMYIQTMIAYRSSGTIFRTFLAENFEFKYTYANKNLSIRFIFKTNEEMSHKVKILSTKYIAGPKKFKDWVDNLGSHEMLANCILKIPKYVKEL